MTVCVYDKPDTMAREHWENGKLLYNIKLHPIVAVVDKFVPPEYYIFDEDIRDWNPGQIIGNPEAIGKDL